jgi:hypothetical protein
MPERTADTSVGTMAQVVWMARCLLLHLPAGRCSIPRLAFARPIYGGY